MTYDQRVGYMTLSIIYEVLLDNIKVRNIEEPSTLELMIRQDMLKSIIDKDKMRNDKHDN